MPHTLLLTLAGPMQSWGSRSRFEDRDTHLEPTKSAVVGLLCAALGRPRHESIADLDALRMGVRTDQPGRPQRDYQTAQDVRTADGSGTKDTVLSTRHYLSDARFLVGLEHDAPALLQQIEAALRNPCWTLSLGRKSYPLALPPLLPDACGGSLRQNTDLQDALTSEPLRYLTDREQRQIPANIRLLIEDKRGNDAYLDSVLSFEERRFALRRVCITTMPTESLKKEPHPCHPSYTPPS